MKNSLIAVGTLGAITLVATSLGNAAIQRGQHGGGGHSGGAQPAHARREVVRTSNYTPLPSAPRPSAPPSQRPQTFQNRNGQQPYRGNISSPPRIGSGNRPTFEHTVQAPSERKFTHTAQGRQYDNGLVLHAGVKVSAGWQRQYFPKGSYHYRFYRHDHGSGVYISPFGFYFGICDPYIANTDCSNYPPAEVYVNVPIYNGNNFQRWTDTDENAFYQPNLDQTEPGLLNATDEITETFQNGNIDALVSLVDPNVSIAIYERGQYQYSMPSNDYVDLTRDAISAVQTSSFQLTYLHQDAPLVFAASGKQVYKGQDGQSRAVYVSFVLQDMAGHWTLTQVETAPDRIQNL